MHHDGVFEDESNNLSNFAVTLQQFRQMTDRRRSQHDATLGMTDRYRRLFETLVRESEGSLITYLRTMVRDPGLVDDLFQETLLTAWEKFDEFDHSRPLGPWLRGIALNLARNAARRRQRDALVFSVEVANEIEARVRSIELMDGDDWQQKSGALAHCLETLSARSRQLICDRYERGRTAAQIANHSASTASAVRKQLQRIREALADCVRQRTAGVATP